MSKKTLYLSLIVFSLLLTVSFVSGAVKFTSPTIDKDFPDMASRIGNWLFTIGLVLTVLMLVIAGYFFATSAGDAQKIQNAKRIILFTLIGFLIISLSSGIIALTKLILNLETSSDKGASVVFSPPVDNSDVLISIPINKSFDTANDNIFTWNTQPIFSLSITGKANINSYDGFARVILTDANNKKYLVYEAIGPFDQGNKSFEYFCQETCTLNGIMPKSLDTELKGASIKIDTIFTLNDINDFSNPVKSQGIAKYTSSLQKQQTTSVIDKINSHNKSKGLRWTAGETGVSSYTYEQKRALFEVRPSENLPNTQGLEYYKGGIYELTPASSAQASSISSLPSSFDWRKRHGKNWMTGVKNQGTCGSCWAFASLGAIEAVSNLYFNQNLNLDLSEQDLVSCYKGPGAFGCEGLEVSRFAYLYQYLGNTGATSEDCFKYQASDLNCSNKCSYWQNEVVKISGGQSISGVENIKNALINQGPIQAGVFVQDSSGTYAHAVVLNGYETDSSGATVWIFKNSWGTSWGEGGYVRVRSTGSPELPWYAIKNPVFIAKQPNLSIKCEDLDGDQYCNWGIGKNKPETCPSFCNQKPDCDDSNPNLGPFDANYNCTSVQPPPPSSKYTLSVSKSGNGSGTITSNPSGINCGSACSASFDSGKSITLTAASSSGSTFMGWSGACSGTSSTCTISMNSNKSAAAEFSSGSTPPPTSCIGSLSCQSAGENAITVRYGFLNCADKVELYQDNVSKSDLGSGTALGLYISAGLKPDTSYKFSLKSGGKIISEQSCSTQPSAPPPSSKYTLSVSKSGNGSGTITSNPSGINCGSACSASFDSGKGVTLNATPSAGSTFVGWSGLTSKDDCNPNNPQNCGISMSSNRQIAANFNTTAPTAHTLTITKNISAGGIITSSPVGINCGLTCNNQSTNFNSGTSVSLTITPAAGYTFTGWSGACSGTSSTCTIGMNSNKTLMANFTAPSSSSLSCSSSTSNSTTLYYSFNNCVSGWVSLWVSEGGSLALLENFAGVSSGSGYYTRSGMPPGTYTYVLTDGNSVTSPQIASATCSTGGTSYWHPCDPINNWKCGETKTGNSPYCEGKAIGWGSEDDGEIACPENTYAASGFCGKKNDDYVITSEARIKMLPSPQTFASMTVFRPKSYWYCKFGCNGWFCGADGCGWAKCQPGQPPVSKIELKIFDFIGRQIYFKTVNNQSTISWDGKNNQGQQMANGTYIYSIETYLPDGRKFIEQDKIYINR